MKKNSSVFAIMIPIVAVLWMILVYAGVAICEKDWIDWGCITAIAVDALIAELYLLVFRKDPGEQATETAALGIIMTAIYLPVMLVINTILVVTRRSDFNWLVLVLNLLPSVIYIICLMWAERQTARLTNQLVRTQQKTARPKEISNKLGQLLAATEDAEVRSRLLKLKEAVDYCSNISTDGTDFSEEQMLIQLETILQLLVSRSDKEEILDKIGLAERTWKMRSSAASTLR